MPGHVAPSPLPSLLPQSRHALIPVEHLTCCRGAERVPRSHSRSRTPLLGDKQPPAPPSPRKEALTLPHQQPCARTARKSKPRAPFAGGSLTHRAGAKGGLTATHKGTQGGSEPAAQGLLRPDPRSSCSPQQSADVDSSRGASPGTLRFTAKAHGFQRPLHSGALLKGTGLQFQKKTHKATLATALLTATSSTAFVHPRLCARQRQGGVRRRGNAAEGG